MSAAVEELLNSAMKLTGSEQLELVAALTGVVQENGLKPFHESWAEEIRRRSAELDAGLVGSVPWSVVKEEGRKQMLRHE